jgi:hypothetical protein
MKAFGKCWCYRRHEAGCSSYCSMCSCRVRSRNSNEGNGFGLSLTNAMLRPSSGRATAQPVLGRMLPVLILSALFSQASSSSAAQVEKPPTFQQYRVAQIYRGKTAMPVFTTRQEREFRTQIRRQAAKGPNFAGHYTLVTWGCGTQCTSFVIVDARTGRILSRAQRENAASPFCNLDSRLMVTEEVPSWLIVNTTSFGPPTGRPDEQDDCCIIARA